MVDTLECGSVIQDFFWRLAKESLPTADVLHHRNMKTHDLCTLCGGSDSWRHICPIGVQYGQVCMGVGTRRNYDTYM
jgi:hypothetical protein